MTMKKMPPKNTPKNTKTKITAQLPKSPTGIKGLDEITGGGLPAGRPTLVCGGPGCGKTLLGMEFLVRGAMQYNEPGVFMAFEETAAELAQNVASLGYNLNELVEQNKLRIDYVRIERSEIQEGGEFDLDGLFIRLADAIDSIGAKRVVLDTIETIFSGLPNPLILRAELRRLFHWLKERGVTAIITGERGDQTLTSQGLEEYVSDCVILLDHRVSGQASIRRIRIIKYRGSLHGTNEYPFLIGETGFSVLPITTLGLQHMATSDRILTGIPGLDAMLQGKGYYRDSSVLVSGTAGSGKSSIAAHFADAACRRGERCLYFAYEESMSQIVRNMRSIGLDLEIWVKKGLLKFHMSRPTAYGLEMHLTTMHKEIEDFKPSVVILDPITGFLNIGSESETKSMLVRMVDYLKSNQITAFFTNLTAGGVAMENTDVGISPLIDTWMMVRDVEISGERNRVMHILKSRGMAHSNQVREFLLTDHGIELKEVYVGPSGVLTGSARVAQEAEERSAELAQLQEITRGQMSIERKRSALEAQIEVLRAEFAAEELEYEGVTSQELVRVTRQEEMSATMRRSRQTKAAEPKRSPIAVRPKAVKPIAMPVKSGRAK
jgi:circadian clock protein KaiC